LSLGAPLRRPAGVDRDRERRRWRPRARGCPEGQAPAARGAQAPRPLASRLRPGPLRQRVAQVEGADPLGARVRAVEEARVDARVRRSRPLVGGLDPELALRQRFAGHLDAAEAAGALGGLEHRDVDLGAEDLAHAAHVGGAAEPVPVAVEVSAAELDAAARLDELVAVGPALAAFAGPGAGGCLLERHEWSLKPAGAAWRGLRRHRRRAEELVDLGSQRGAGLHAVRIAEA